MARGDPQRYQDEFEQQTGQAANRQGNLQGLQDRQYGNFETQFGPAAQAGQMGYDEIMGGYRNLLSQIPGIQQQAASMSGGGGPSASGLWQDFAKTGGYSDRDLANIRDRAGAVNRAVYSNAQDEVARKQNITGGYAPNAPAAMAKMAREQSYNLADTATNSEAMIAGLRQQGKLAGLQGLTSSYGQDAANARAGQQDPWTAAKLQGDILTGMTNTYGQVPGRQQIAGNQLLTAGGQQISTQQAGNQLATDTVRGQGARSQVPGTDWKGWVDMGVKGAGAIIPVLGGGKKKPEAAPYGQGYGVLQPQQSQQSGGGGSKWLDYANTAASFFSDRNMKEDIKPVKGSITDGLKKLPISNWKYKGDKTTHIGPMAQDFQKIFGVGDGKTIHMADVSGVLLKLGKEVAEKS